MRYVIGVICIGLGFLLVWKAEWLMNNFGRIAWAEEKLGMEGGTRLLYKLIGITIIIFAFLYMGGVIEAILSAIFRPTIETME